ncbi:MAG: endolytic transglycosylase MltG [Deltaproteobacteria bacterium]|nr:MAG: endolytic transglycosylase MltG [Deltaproteobacteria bacterium]
MKVDRAVRRSLLRALEVFVVACGLAVTIYCVLFIRYLYTTPPFEGWEPKQVVVEKGEPFRDVVKKLAREGVISSEHFFAFLGFVTGSTKKIQAGEYLFPAPSRPVHVLSKLVRGDVRKYYVLIPEGANVYEIAERLADMGLVDRERFLSLATSREVARKFGIDSRSLEGYLFPDTYVFVKGMGEEAILRVMVERFREVVTPEMEERAREMGLTLDQVITVASIVEKETSVDSEKPIIASIIYRRLKKGMRLQMDPTVIYGLKKWDGKLTREDLRTPNPFNTYVIKGLPPGPISNPGEKSIRAALYPADTDYLYFVSRNNGTHYFSRTLREHINAVNRYQRRRWRRRR